jgi:trehalose 6-phosphate phosphatase
LLICDVKQISEQIEMAARLWLFLDYDGTLADFAPSPDIVEPDPELNLLLSKVSGLDRIRLTVVSGRRLDHVRKLVTTPRIWLAGSYGLEMFSPEGERIDRVEDASEIRARLEALKPIWEALVAQREGFYLEDKGLTLALHARYARQETAGAVLEQARRLGQTWADNIRLRYLGGENFLEICPLSADKGQTIEYLLKTHPFEGALPIYIGDDDKDEAAFAAVKRNRGVAILVSPQPRPSQADCRFTTVAGVRRWLDQMA